MRYFTTTKLFKTLMLAGVAFGSFALNACSKDDLKDDADTRTSISVAVNDTSKVFGLNTFTSTANNVTVAQGYASDGTKLSITIPGTLVAGKSYSSGTDKATVIYTVNEDTDKKESYSNINSAVVDLVVTSATDAAAQGTFSGSLLQENVPGNAKTKVITNGKFNIKLK
ncbi:hypothetical protein D0C36_23165 [Mucilaginibacter conchicola]|uniref:Uncharacterized protein n=1 Tax=Mucilaginibacter conchicola TaxID=2303333 RepID=A0A372NPG4_9SPHI|nr:hypothetical protein [Mucilaginibacter conchicola]RFZ90143.1 hypothetical protein D0C36_23165 [Mucilaginibacter conchicola]